MLTSREYPLNSGTVETIVEELRQFLNEQKTERRNALRVSLAFDGLLVRLLESDEPPQTCTLAMGRRFGRPLVLLRYGGKPFDPTGSGTEDGWSDRLLAALGLSPEWSYRGGMNTVRLRLPKATGAGRLLWLLIAVLSAGILGAAGALMPPTLVETLTETLLTPIFNAFLGLLNTLAGVMIFLTVSAGVFGIGDASSLNRIGKTMFPRYIGSAFLVSALSLLIASPFVHLHAAPAVQGDAQLGAVSEMIFNILPSNPVRPFLDGNMLQIIVLSAFTGVVLLTLGEKARRVDAMIEECGLVLRTMMEYVCGLIPLFVFASLLRQIWSGSVGAIIGLWKPICLYLLSIAAFAVLLLLATSIRTKTSPALLLKKIFPSFLVAFTTASSMAAYSSAADACREELGIDDKLFDFGFPIGVVIYMPGGVVTFAVLSLYLAEVYGAQTNASWFIMAGLLAAVLSVAIPPTPGAMLTCYGILMAQLGVPMEGMLLAAAFDIVQDFFSSGLDVALLELELVNQAELLSMLDKDALHRN